MQDAVLSTEKPSYRPLHFVIDNAVRYISFQSPSQMTTACHWPKAIFLNGTLCSVSDGNDSPLPPLCLGVTVPQGGGGLLIGLEYIVHSVETSAGNVHSLLLSLNQQ